LNYVSQNLFVVYSGVGNLQHTCMPHQAISDGMQKL